MAVDRDKGEWSIGELPAEWTWAPFGEVFDDNTSNDKKVKQADYLEFGALPVVDQGQEIIGGYTNDMAYAYGGPLPAIVFGDHTRCVKFLERQFAQGADGVRVLIPSPALVPNTTVCPAL